VHDSQGDISTGTLERRDAEGGLTHPATEAQEDAGTCPLEAWGEDWTVRCQCLAVSPCCASAGSATKNCGAVLEGLVQPSF
jgi:hypothetical protein